MTVLINVMTPTTISSSIHPAILTWFFLRLYSRWWSASCSFTFMFLISSIICRLCSLNLWFSTVSAVTAFVFSSSAMIVRCSFSRSLFRLHWSSARYVALALAALKSVFSSDISALNSFICSSFSCISSLETNIIIIHWLRDERPNNWQFVWEKYTTTVTTVKPTTLKWWWHF